MYLLQKDPAAQLLKSYLPPFKGTWKTLPAHLLPDDTVQDSYNCTLLGGKLRSRCGLERFVSDNLQEKVIGSFLTVDTTNSKYPIISTPSTVYRFKDNIWENLNGSNLTLTSAEVKQVRMTSIQIGDSVYVLYANGVDSVKYIPQDTYEVSNITPQSGSIPVLSDICTSFARIIGVLPPYTVAWCDAVNNNHLAFTNWPTLNQFICSDTEDSIVAIRSIGTLGVAVYKEGNIFIGFAQAGSSSQAFRFEHRGEYEGPAGVQAVVNVNGAHMYLTSTGRVALFDGSRHDWICDGIWPFLQTDIDTEFASAIHGCYNYRTAEVTFWYPKVGSNGECTGMLIIDIPYPLAGVQSFSYFPGESNFSCSNSLSVRLFNSLASPLVFSSTGRTFQLSKDHYADDSLDFPCSFTTGLSKPPLEDIAASQSVYLPVVEFYANRGNVEQGMVDVSIIANNLLENEGVPSSSESIDLREEPISQYLAFNTEGSYLGVRFDWQSSSKFEYKGCDIYGTKV